MKEIQRNRKGGFVTMVLMALGLPVILLLATVIFDETRVRSAYAQATEALLVAYREAGANYGASLSNWGSEYPPPSNLFCKFIYSEDGPPSSCDIASNATKAMSSDAAVTYSNVACGEAVDYLKSQTGVFGFVSQDSRAPEKGIRAEFGIVSFDINSAGAVSVLGKSSQNCGRTDVEDYQPLIDGLRASEVATEFVGGSGVSKDTFNYPDFVQLSDDDRHAPLWFVGVIGIKVNRYFEAPDVKDTDYVYARLIAPLQTVAALPATE